MPIFEYVCRTCHHQFEHLALSQSKPRCPECGGAKLERQVEIFAQGRPSPEVRGLNSSSVIAHARALLGNIPALPRYETRFAGSPGRRSRRSTTV